MCKYSSITAIRTIMIAKITPTPSNISTNLLMVPSKKKRGVGSCPYKVKIIARNYIYDIYTRKEY